MPDEIKPCPFCGEPVDRVDARDDAFRVECLACGARGPVYADDRKTYEELRELALEAWNKPARAKPPGDDVPVAEIALSIGKRIARRVFDKRSSRGKGLRNVEAHMSETELSVACATAAQLGIFRGAVHGAGQ